MVMRDKLRDRAAEVRLPQRNHAIETFLLDRPNETIAVYRPRGTMSSGQGA